jgi:uncharacterized protein YkwD
MKSGLRAQVGRLGGAVVVLLLALGPAVVVAAPAAEAYTPSLATKAAYQNRVLQQVNVMRVRYHRVVLKSTYCPTWYAARWAGYLARTGAFYHQPMLPMLNGCRASVVAENLARGYSTADGVVAGWMASPGHRANILDGRLTRIGVAAVYGRGGWTVAADFTRS